MTQPKKMKKVKGCGCFDWLFARRKHRSPSEDFDSTVEETKNAGAQDDAGEQGQGSLGLVCLKNAAQPLAVVEEELPSDTQDADGVVGKAEMEGNSKRPQTLIIIIHMVKRERVNKPVDETTVVEKDWTPKESHGKRVQTLIITLHMVKREQIKGACEELPSEPQDTAGDAQPHEGVKEELPSEPQDTAGDAQPHEGVKEDLPFEQEQGVVSEAVTEPSEKTPLKSCFKKKDAPPNPAEKVVRFNFQNLNTFVKDRELYCGYDYFKYGFPLAMIRAELQKLKERTVKPQKEPAKEAVNKQPEPEPEPQHRTGILKKGKTASTAHKCLRFDLQNLNTLVKDRELYCGYDYFKYGFPLAMIRAEQQKLKETTVKPQKEPAKEAVNKQPEPQKTVTEKATDSDNKNTEPQHRTGILKKGKTVSTAHKCLRFNLQNLNTFVKDRELYCGYDYFKYGFPLSSIRSELQEPKETTVKPQEGPVKEAVNKRDPLQKQTVREGSCAPMNTTTEGKSLKGILQKERMPRSTCPKHVRFNLGNLRAPVKERELYRGHDYFRYAAPLQVTQSANLTSRTRRQPVRSASNSLRGAPRHLGRPMTQRSNDSFQQHSGRNAAHNYTDNRHSQHRHHNSSSYVSPRYETRYFYEGQTNPGTNSRSRSRVKRGAKPSDGDVLGAQGEYTAS